MEYSKSSDLVEKLKEEAKAQVVVDGIVLCIERVLRLIDALCRLGISHHFQPELHHWLLPSAASASQELDLLHTSLRFRLLRQHAVPVSPGVFEKFMDVNGKFANELAEDTAGLLSLYEASHLGFMDEQVMEEAKDFSYKNLSNYLLQSNSTKLKGRRNNNLCQQVQLSLQTPLHWRLPRVEARNFINLYQQLEHDDDDDDHNYYGAPQQHEYSSALLHLAKLEYNLKRELYLDELKQVTGWWKALKIKNELSFARDRLEECYFWAMGSIPEAGVSKGRKSLAKYACLATVLDDIYDIQGSFDDLQKFTQAVSQWDIKAASELPEYMKVFYGAMMENAEEALRDATEHLHPKTDLTLYIKEQWGSYCKSMLVMAKWSKERYMPRFEDYMRNAWVTIGISPGVCYALLAHGPFVAQYLPACLENWATSEHFYWPSLIGRLHDDLTFSKDEVERGEPNGVLCYMTEHGVTRQQAEAHLKNLIADAWTKLIDLGRPEARTPHLVHNVALNTARSVERIYLHSDWFGDRTQPNQDTMAQYLLNTID